MNNGISKLFVIAASAAALWTAFPGPVAADPADAIKAGDPVEIHYTCRLKSGESVATTEQSVADDASLKKSNIFYAHHQRDPIKESAGGIGNDTPAAMLSRFKDFEAQVANELLSVVAGRKPGEYRNVEIKIKPVYSPHPGENDLPMALVRKRPKEMNILKSDYRAQFGKEPVIGDLYVRDPAIPGTIDAVTDLEAVVKFLSVPGKVVDTPFGKGTIRDGGDHWEIVIDAQVGRLVRTGPIVGRISKITKDVFIIDFGAPFKDEPLQCDFSVNRVKTEPAGEQKDGSDKEAHKQ